MSGTGARAYPEVILASSNPGKLIEVRAILGDLPVSLRALGAFPEVQLPEEGTDYEENAVTKARVAARDAAETVDIDYQELDAVTSVTAAAAEGAPQVWEEAPGNVCYDWEIGDAAATDAAFASASKIASIDIVNNRLVANAIEPAGAMWTTSIERRPQFVVRLLAPQVSTGATWVPIGGPHTDRLESVRHGSPRPSDGRRHVGHLRSRSVVACR